MSGRHPLIAKMEALQTVELDLTPPPFRPGDTIRVGVRVVEGENERVQMFEGVCISRRNRGVSSTFTVRKISYGEGVERVFPLYSKRVASIELVKTGKSRRAKLYYLRERRGKSARIAERVRMAKVLADHAAASALKSGKSTEDQS